MDISKISTIIESHRPLPEIDSLPFVISDDGKVAGFNYFLVELETEVEIHVRDIFVVDSNDNIEKFRTHIVHTVEIKEYDEPEIEEEEYLSLLEEQLLNFSYDRILKLITRVEFATMWSVYQSVIKHLEEKNII